MAVLNDQAINNVKKEIETLKKIYILLDDAERLAKGLTVVELSNPRTNLKIALDLRYQQLGRLIADNP